MNFNEFNELRVKGIEVIAKFVADNIGKPDNTVDLSGIQSQITALQVASTKAARIEAVQDLQEALNNNAAVDAGLKERVDALAASLGDANSTQLKASVDKLLADVKALQAGGGSVTSERLQELQTEINDLSDQHASDIGFFNSQLSSMQAELTNKLNTSDFSKRIENLATVEALNILQSRVTTLQSQVNTLANTRSKSKVVDISSTDVLDTFDGANLISVMNTTGENRNITKFTSGVAGQKIDIRLYANSTIVHDNSFIRCKGNVNVNGTNANQFITFVCISGGGSSGSNGVWLEISRNF